MNRFDIALGKRPPEKVPNTIGTPAIGKPSPYSLVFEIHGKKYYGELIKIERMASPFGDGYGPSHGSFLNVLDNFRVEISFLAGINDSWDLMEKVYFSIGHRYYSMMIQEISMSDDAMDYAPHGAGELLLLRRVDISGVIVEGAPI